MRKLSFFLTWVVAGAYGKVESLCRTMPGNIGFPSSLAWDVFNASIDGRLIPVVPSAKYCQSLPTGYCSESEWSNEAFRSYIPGAMEAVCWEQVGLTAP